MYLGKTGIHKRNQATRCFARSAFFIWVLFFCNSCVIHKGFQICFAKACVWDPMLSKLKIMKKHADIKMANARKKTIRRKHHKGEPGIAKNRSKDSKKPPKDSIMVYEDENRRPGGRTELLRSDTFFLAKDTIAKSETGDTVSKKNNALQIHYPNDGAAISETDKRNINNYLYTFDVSKIKKISIIGYTDNKGDETHNKELSYQRAQIINAYFLELGVKQTLIIYEGLAEKNPVSTNDTPEGRKLNRRTELIIE